MEAVSNLLKELGRHIGLEQMELDEDGQCTLAFDEEIVVTFVADPDGGLNAVSFVGEIPESGGMSLVTALLEENFLPSNHGGARFALEPNSNRIVLVTRWDAQKTDLSLFSNQLESYVNSIDAMQKALASGEFADGGSSGGSGASGKSGGGDYIPPPGSANFA
jgi:hypothetical protein